MVGENVTEESPGSSSELDRAADRADDQILVPPDRPEISAVWTADEVRALPHGTVVTWQERWTEERHAAVVTVYDAPAIRHTRDDYWNDTIDLIEFPATALTWPADIADRSPELQAKPAHDVNQT
jgi:hypothetical protein